MFLHLSNVQDRRNRSDSWTKLMACPRCYNVWIIVFFRIWSIQVRNNLWFLGAVEKCQGIYQQTIEFLNLFLLWFLVGWLRVKVDIFFSFQKKTLWKGGKTLKNVRISTVVDQQALNTKFQPLHERERELTFGVGLQGFVPWIFHGFHGFFNWLFQGEEVDRRSQQTETPKDDKNGVPKMD